jgi:prepilin-type N-terminal cleavage/methylation domain-containing protein
MKIPHLTHGHPFLATDGGLWCDSETRLRIVRGATITGLRRILDDTPGLQQGVRQAAERRLRWLSGETHAPRRRVHSHAFTLLETLVAVAIIGLCMAILLPTVSRSARVARARAEWVAYWHGAQIHQASVQDEFTSYWQMTPEQAFARLYEARGVTWSSVDASLLSQWRTSTAALH